MMTVEDLIKKLQEFNPHAFVYVCASMGGADEDAYEVIDMGSDNEIVIQSHGCNDA